MVNTTRTAHSTPSPDAGGVSGMGSNRAEHLRIPTRGAPRLVFTAVRAANKLYRSGILRARRLELVEHLAPGHGAARLDGAVRGEAHEHRLG